MKQFMTAAVLSLAAFSALAVPPKQLITHNTTDFESNAFVDNLVPSRHPTKAHSDGKIFWTAVKLACFGHTVNGQCSATIYMGTNTPTPVPVGSVIVNLETGDINPKQVSGNGFTITVNGPGETTISRS